MHLHGASCAFRLSSPQTRTNNLVSVLLLQLLQLIPDFPCECACPSTSGFTQPTLHMCVLIPCFVGQQGCLPMALDESFRHAPADIDRGRHPPCSLQSLSGIWLCYRLNSSHELGFFCSHHNALVSFFYEAPSQRKVAVTSFCLPNCHLLKLLRMLALEFTMTYLFIWAQVWEESIALIELFAQFLIIS